MNKIFLSLLIALAFVTSAAAQTPQQSICELHAPGWTGTGTLIGVSGDQGLILTARHVADRVGLRMTANWLWAPRPVSTPCVVIAILPGLRFDTDMAAIVTTLPKSLVIKPVAVVPFDAANGPWTAWGFRGGKMRLARVSEARVQDNYVFLNAALVPGMSGGPCLDRFGRIVAVDVASDFATLGIAADGPALRDFVNQYRK
jgi:S1-C subfamily serine protease